ncbi:unnamed protein product [Rhizophagus irregularis]|nr:unnamed protein product [Rhizophagus irregularis]
MVKYEIGTCYGCRKCMYCGYDLNTEVCKCDKTIKPKLSNRTKVVPHSFSRNFELNMLLCKKTFIQERNTLYLYNSNFKKRFIFTFCSTCNSQFQRISNKTKAITKDESIVSSVIIDVDKIVSSQDMCSISSENESVDQHDEISFTLIVKKVDGKQLPGKWLTFDASTFKKFVTQIQKYIETMIGEEIDQAEYSLAFKSAKSNGGGLELSELKDFEKFLIEYKKLFKMKKEVVVIASMNRKIVKKKKRKQVEDEILESDEEENNLKKKKVNSIPKVSGLTPHQKVIGKLVSELREQWHCSQDNVPCYVASGIHLKLTAKLLAMWAESIMDGTATIEIAPTHPDFAVQHATKNNVHSSATLMASQMSQMYPIQPIQYISPQYCMVREPLAPVSNFSATSQLPIPSIEEFLKKIDKDEGDNGDFMQFIDVFNEQNISVKHIKDLDENDFQILGVKTIGWRKTIKAAAKRYE